MSLALIGSVVNPSYYEAGPYAFVAPTNPSGYVGRQYQEHLAGERSWYTAEILAFSVASYQLGLYPDTEAGWQQFMAQVWSVGTIALARAARWDLVELVRWASEEGMRRRGELAPGKQHFARFGQHEHRGNFFYHWQVMGAGDPDGAKPIDWNADPFGYGIRFNRFGAIIPIAWREGNRGRYLVNGELVVHLSGNPGIYRLTPFGLEGPLPGTAHVDWYKGIGADVLQQYRDTTPAPSVPEHYWWDYTPEGEDPGGDPDPGGGDPGGGGTPKPPVIPPATGGGDGTGYGDLAQGRRRVPLTIFGGAGTLFDFDNGHTDHGEPIRVALQFDPLVPAGAGGEAIFPCAYLTVTSSMEVTLTVTPILDGVAREAERQTIQVPGGTRRTTHHYEIPLYLAAAFGRFALRGTRLAVRIESPGIAPGDLIFDSVELEHETVRESKRPQ